MTTEHKNFASPLFKAAEKALIESELEGHDLTLPPNFDELAPRTKRALLRELIIKSQLRKKGYSLKRMLKSLEAALLNRRGTSSSEGLRPVPFHETRVQRE